MRCGLTNPGFSLHGSTVTLSVSLHAALILGILFFGPLMPGKSDRAETELRFAAQEALPEIEEVPEEELEPEELPPPEPILSEVPDEPVLESKQENFDTEEIEDLPPDPDLPRNPKLWLSRVLPKKQPDQKLVEAEKAEAQKPQPPVQDLAAPQPVLGKNPPPNYPRRAVRLGIEGTVLVVVEVAKDGSVRSATLKHSSGSRILDQAALASVKTWIFDHGPGTAEVPFVFSLKDR